MSIPDDAEVCDDCSHFPGYPTDETLLHGPGDTIWCKYAKRRAAFVPPYPGPHDPYGYWSPGCRLFRPKQKRETNAARTPRKK
ncbi:hypothetical protein [Desulfocurvibacter africanus]|uniref:hypothetical protein n=1 Tax=Desulfocurvibacter africanus TaxID=873 RepID=UPI0002D88A31|nr:hypothetical protein [Desulfocurvibacter africanus]